METLKQIISIIGWLAGMAGVAGLFIGLSQYKKQQKFNRLQNLSSIWKKFTEDKDLLNLFKILNEDNFKEVQNYSKETKWKFLALLDEVALFTDEFAVDKKQAAYLFKWHFRFVFIEESKESFWDGIGGIEEMNKPDWRKCQEFSKNCNDNYIHNG